MATTFITRTPRAPSAPTTLTPTTPTEPTALPPPAPTALSAVLGQSALTPTALPPRATALLAPSALTLAPFALTPTTPSSLTPAALTPTTPTALTPSAPGHRLDHPGSVPALAARETPRPALPDADEAAAALDLLPDATLLATVRTLTARSNATLAALLVHLGEVGARGLHRERA